MHECDYNTHDCDFNTQKTRFDTYERDYDTHERDYNTQDWFEHAEYDSQTQSVISTHTRVI
jgi:hypothetical protein